MITRQEEILKAIVKELHEMNKKLDHIGQASSCIATYFNSGCGSYKYVEDSKEDPNSQDKHIV